jgi:hypothetical protein
MTPRKTTQVPAQQKGGLRLHGQGAGVSVFFTGDVHSPNLGCMDCGKDGPRLGLSYPGPPAHPAPRLGILRQALALSEQGQWKGHGECFQHYTLTSVTDHGVMQTP